jgi:hypothetical protein
VRVDNVAGRVAMAAGSVGEWLHDMVAGHLVAIYRASGPKVYVDGELRKDVTVGGGGIGMWLRFPGDGRYFIIVEKVRYQGPIPVVKGRFEGTVIEFSASGRAVRMESSSSLLPNYPVAISVLGPVPDR